MRRLFVTLLLANMQSTVAAPYLLPTSFDPVNGFTAVTFIGTVPNVLVVNPTKNDVTTLAQWQRLAQDTAARDGNPVRVILANPAKSGK